MATIKELDCKITALESDIDYLGNSIKHLCVRLDDMTMREAQVSRRLIELENPPKPPQPSGVRGEPGYCVALDPNYSQIPKHWTWEERAEVCDLKVGDNIKGFGVVTDILDFTDEKWYRPFRTKFFRLVKANVSTYAGYNGKVYKKYDKHVTVIRRPGG